MRTTHVGLGVSPEKRAGARMTVATTATLVGIALAIGAQGCKKTAAVDDGQKTDQTPAAVAATPPKAKHPPRQLDDVNRKELETTLPKGAPVEITAPDGDDEAFMLAQQIRAFLHAEKYPVHDVVVRPPDPSAKGVGLEPLPDGKWRVVVGVAE